MGRKLLTVVWVGLLVLATPATGWTSQQSEDIAITDFDDDLTGPGVPDPTTRSECRNGQWSDLLFSNQGQCIRSVNTGYRA